MNDPDIILYLVPHDGEGFNGAELATAMLGNEQRYLPARQSQSLRSRDNPHREERGSTELLEERGLFENTDRIVLRFSDGAKTRVGVVCGRGANVDLAIPRMPGVSRFHLAFTFDDQNRPIVRDLGSKGGTKVTYNGEVGGRLSNVDWPLLGPSIARGKAPVLNITDLVQFKVIVSPCDIESLDYIEKVKKFREGTADPEQLFPSLNIQSTQGTRLPTGQQTPTTGFHPCPVFYEKKIGSGQYGTVKYVWNAREEYVVKQPRGKVIRSGKFNKEAWKREIEIMRSISHAHIVAFRAATLSPYPQLELEYVPGGSLDNYSRFSTSESTQVLYQLSSALGYLHKLKPPVAHRDIKPANILVAARGEDTIYVKFADFGLSRAADVLETFCGTLLWLAPELYLKDPYGVQIDMYSLGVVIAWLECDGLPKYKSEWQTDATAWMYAVQTHVTQHAKTQNRELLDFILDNMLVEDPDERSSADYCHDEASKLLARITDSHRQESNDDIDDDDGSSTPKHPAFATHSCGDSKGTQSAASAASTFPTLSSLKTVKQYSPGIESQIWNAPSFAVANNAKRRCTRSSSSNVSRQSEYTDLERHPDNGINVALSFITEWDGGSQLRPFNKSEALGHSAKPSPRSQQPAPFPAADDQLCAPKTLNATADMRATITQVPSPGLESDTLRRTTLSSFISCDAQGSDHGDVAPPPTFSSLPTVTYISDIHGDPTRGDEEACTGQRRTEASHDRGICGPPAAKKESRSSLQNKAVHRNDPPAAFDQVFRQTQQPTERKFLVVSTEYGQIHLLAQGPTLLVNATNIAKTFGLNQVRTFKDRPNATIVLTNERDPRLHGTYYTVESALRFCDLLLLQLITTPKQRAIGPVLKKTLQGDIEHHLSGLKPLSVVTYDQPSTTTTTNIKKCRRCTNLHIKCNRGDPCQRCIQANEDCLYSAHK